MLRISLCSPRRCCRAALGVPVVLALLAGCALALVGLAVVVPSASAAPGTETGTVESTAAAADDEVSWTVTPATSSGPDSSRISLRHVLDPGASVADAVAVTNTSAQAADFVVETGDGILGDGGAFDIAADEPVDGGSWVSVDGVAADGVLSLAAGETRVLPITIAVPAEATPGDHPAGIVVGRTSGDGTVAVTHRIGVRIHLQVAGALNPQLEVSNVETSFEASLVPFAPGTLTVTYDVANVGNVRLGAAAIADAAGPFGLARATSEAVTTDELLPGDEASATLTFEVWPTVYAAGELELSPLVVGDDTVADPQGDAAGYRFAAISWTGLAVLALLVVAGVVVWRRQRGPAEPDPTPEPEKEPVGAGAGAGSRCLTSLLLCSASSLLLCSASSLLLCSLLTQAVGGARRSIPGRPGARRRARGRSARRTPPSRPSPAVCRGAGAT